ncbi:MAG: DUF1549 domain-containing protein [Planctomycetes bacterium]|nr:DUF1549 domain-containing protein [Planctomycetota bacterium]
MRSSLVLFVFALPMMAQAVTQSDALGSDEFERHVRPLLARSCYGCHSEKSGKSKGGLLLDSVEGLRKGGSTGPLFVAGRPDESLIVEVLGHEGEIRMPPKERLPASEVARVRDWILHGAVLPTQQAVLDAAAASVKHWAFQTPPSVIVPAGLGHELDRLLAAHQGAQHVPVSPRADKETLLRRVTLTLHGLPPTPEELSAFLADTSINAFAKVVDRLLASPRYGEHMARYWLDIARYADSNGADENHAMAEAWRYRDWVVRAFNADMPYNQFITEQVAGDLLPEDGDSAATAERLLATGFLVLGPKMLAEQDKDKMLLDVVDEQMDVLFRSTLGVGTSCARCHDHKFDPLPTRDYYALAGMFASTRTFQHTNFVSRWMERPLGLGAEIAERQAHTEKLNAAVKTQEQVADNAEQTARQSLATHFADYLLAADNASRSVLSVEAEDFASSNLGLNDHQWGDKRSTVIHTVAAGTQQFAEYEFERSGRHALLLRYAAEESRPVRVLLDGAVLCNKALGKVTGTWQVAGQRWEEIARVDLSPGRHRLRFESDSYWPHVDKLRLVPVDGDAAPFASLTPSGLDPVVLRAAVDALEAARRTDDPRFAVWHDFAALAADADETAVASAMQHTRERSKGRGPMQELAVVLEGPPLRDRRELAGRLQALCLAALQQAKPADFEPKAARGAALALVAGAEGLFWLRAEELRALWSAEQVAAHDSAKAQVAELKRTAPPPLSHGLAVEAAPLKRLQVMPRGDHLAPVGEPVPAGTPLSMSGTVPALVVPEGASGRLELAHWMTDPQHPLTARVMANRLWLWLFGEGLVRTPSDFGIRGDTPAMPDVLDWSAGELVRGDWSVKSMVRNLLLSEAWQRSSASVPGQTETDPENRTFARGWRRRLRAEEVRDGVLAVVGTLDLTPFGAPFKVGNGQIVTSDQSVNLAKYDTPRRSLWLPVVRNAMYEVFTVFDYVDASGPMERRGQSVQPQQVLFFMNSALVRDACAHLGRTLAAESGTEDERLQRVWTRFMLRIPEPEQLIPLRQLLVQTKTAGLDAAASWAAVCQTLFASNGWLHVD